MVDIAANIRTQLVSAINEGNAPASGIDTLAQNMLNQVSSILNVDLDGRHLFAGSKTNTRPVDLNDAAFLVPPATYPSTADTTYYQGDAELLSVRADVDLNRHIRRHCLRSRHREIDPRPAPDILRGYCAKSGSRPLE